jgi:hypothetical protein
VTSFIGRDVELKRLVELVRDHRLVTLTGAGGVGKTRLAIQVAAELVMDFGDGVWLAELASVADPDAVPDVVATALDVTARTGTVTDSITTAALTIRHKTSKWPPQAIGQGTSTSARAATGVWRYSAQTGTTAFWDPGQERRGATALGVVAAS